MKYPITQELEYLDFEKRRKMLFSRDRGLAPIFEPYSHHEIRSMFMPYMEHLDHKGLSPREVRLLETIIDLYGEHLKLQLDLDVLLAATTVMIYWDPENQVPVCHCCGMELDYKNDGHRRDCLADLIIQQARQHNPETTSNTTKPSAK